MKKNMLTATDYKVMFMNVISSGKAIYNKAGEQLILEEGEIFKQCYDEVVLSRRRFPKYWFISNKSNLVSIWGGKARWLKNNRRAVGHRGSYKYMDEQTSGLKSIEAHDLTGLVHESSQYGRAKKLIEEKGIDAFGVKKAGEFVVNGHHIDGNDKNNDSENIQFLMAPEAHDLADRVPKVDASEEEVIKYMQKLARIAEIEEPNAITVLMTNQTLDPETTEWNEAPGGRLDATRRILFSERAANQVMAMISALQSQ